MNRIGTSASCSAPFGCIRAFRTADFGAIVRRCGEGSRTLRRGRPDDGRGDRPLVARAARGAQIPLRLAAGRHGGPDARFPA